LSQRFFPVILLFTIVVFAIIVFASIPVSAQAPSAPAKPLPPGPMQAKVKAACTQCHNTGRIMEQHLSRQQWTGELQKMEGLGAVIDDADRDAILAYLTKNFGPSKTEKTPEKKAE
jgi:hypothetical protein